MLTAAEAHEEARELLEDLVDELDDVELPGDVVVELALESAEGTAVIAGIQIGERSWARRIARIALRIQANLMEDDDG